MVKFLQDAKNNCIMQIDFQELAQNLPGSCSKLGITVAKCREQSFCDVRTEIQVKGVFAMAVFFVNGKEVEVPKNQKLLRYLRDELHLTSVKDGCSEGACGACTVIIDGETIRACTPMTDRLEGKHIITVEGLTDEEKAEQAAIRREYIDSVKASLKAQLDNTYIVDENGEKHKVQPKKKQ